MYANVQPVHEFAIKVDLRQTDISGRGHDLVERRIGQIGLNATCAYLRPRNFTTCSAQKRSSKSRAPLDRISAWLLVNTPATRLGNSLNIDPSTRLETTTATIIPQAGLFAPRRHKAADRSQQEKERPATCFDTWTIPKSLHQYGRRLGRGKYPCLPDVGGVFWLGRDG